MSNLATDTSKLPPMLLQYLDYKGRYPEALLFFQVGDFYEVFFDDAVTVSRALNLTLTSRDKNSENPVPMCGVPIAVIEGYIDRLLAQRFSVALVSQKEVSEGHKGPVERALDRIVTPGIQILSHSSIGRAASFVAAITVDNRNEYALAYSEVQSGIIQVRDGLDIKRLVAELQRIAAAELIVPTMQGVQRIDRRSAWVRELEVQLSETALRFRPERALDSDGERQVSLAAVTGYAAQSPMAKRALRSLVDYVDEVMAGARMPLVEVRTESDSGTLLIDSMTRTNLEIVRNNRDGGVDGSLFQLLDCTVTAGGSKLLKQWLLAPLAEVEPIIERQEAVADLKRSWERKDLRSLLSRVIDGERVAVRIDLGVVTPRELAALRDTLAVLPQLKELLGRMSAIPEGGQLIHIAAKLCPLTDLHCELSRVLQDEPPLATNQGAIIRQGVDAELDRLRIIAEKGKSWIEELEQAERARSGISSLKIKFTSVFGYFIEITNSQLAKVPADYIRKQTTANAERFFTDELKRRELEILGADDKALIRERELFNQLRDSVKQFVAQLRTNSALLSQLDVLSSFAELAEKEGFQAPQMVASDELHLLNGRHPVLSQMLGNEFIANSLQMEGNKKKCLIVTGPNMGGKSTFLRQAALLVIMAQIGSYLPVESARIGIVDRIFARIGASDNLREGESTFMVEMREASAIIASASERSLVLIDEIGRGTATLDGLALAQAILEWMVVKSKARVLFATHFHELTLLEERYSSVKNLSVGSEDRGKKIVFTHRIVEGAASRSYGLEVAERAGLPAALMSRARILHNELMVKEDAIKVKSPQLSLFQEISHAQPTLVEIKPDLIREQLRTLDVDSIAPRDALTLLFDLQQKVLSEEDV
jgi:DNA mismatch repair protein MutS